MKCSLLYPACMMLLLACSDKETEVSETFDDKDRPFFMYDSQSDQYILLPWNYDKPENEDRAYPLIVYLHGSGGAGNISYLNYIGNDDPDDNRVDSTAYKFQKTHPCFTLIPQTTAGWDNASLIEQVEEFKHAYRIDVSRIYLIGYSMGGSGSWSFANAYYDHNGHLFAGIVRLAGQSQTRVRDEIAEKTAIWLHIGLEDTPTRVSVTREAYEFLSNYHNHPKETTSAVTIPGYTGTTYSLIIDNKDAFKRTEYEGVGHGVAAFPFKDPYLIAWLFSQKL